MKTYQPSLIPRDTDPRLYLPLKNMDAFLRDLQAGMLRIERGYMPTQGAGPIPTLPGTLEHHDLLGLVPETGDPNDDHTQYLNILGRSGGQTAYLDDGTGGSSGTWAVGDGEVMAEEGAYAAATSTGFTMQSACTVGETVLMVCAVAGNNNTMSSGDGATNYITSLTDPVGNTWTKIHEYSLEGAGGVRNEIVSLWYSVIAFTYNTVDENIIVNVSITQDSVYLIGHSFTGVLTPTVTGTTVNHKNDGVADWDSIAHTDAGSNNTLYLRCGCAWRGISSEEWTGTAGFTDAVADWNDVTYIDPSCARMEFKIAAGGSTQTSAPTEANTQYHACFIIALDGGVTPSDSYIYSSDAVDEAYIKWSGPALELSASGGITVIGDTGITGDVAIVGGLTVTPGLDLLNTDIFGDVLAAAVTRGAILIGNATPLWSSLIVGTVDQVLISDGTDLAWTTPPWLRLDGTVAMTGDLDMGDNDIIGINDLIFTDVVGAIAGIENQNLLDATGKSGGQTLIGGTDASDDLEFQTTSDGTKGDYIFAEFTVAGFLKNDASGIVTGGNMVTAVSRSAQVGTVIDMTGDEIKYLTLVANTTFTISNPSVGRMILLELDGVFTVTLPGTVVVINGDYIPAIGKNYLFLFCNDDVTPEYVASWGVTI